MFPLYTNVIHNTYVLKLKNLNNPKYREWFDTKDYYEMWYEFILEVYGTAYRYKIKRFLIGLLP